MAEQNNNQLQVILKDQGVPAEQAKQLIEAFGGPFEEAGEILANYQSIKVTDVNDHEGMAAARQKRLALKAARTTVERNRKQLKESITKTGRAIDSVARFVKETIAPAEEYLQLQEDFAKLEAKRQHEAKMQDRVEQLRMRGADPALYNYEGLPDAAFDQLLSDIDLQNKKAAEEAAKAEAERKAAAEAEAKRQAEIEAENARLKKEAEEREAAAQKEREAAEIKQAEIRGRINMITKLGMVWSDVDEAYILDTYMVTKAQVEADDTKEFDAILAKVTKHVDAVKAEQAKAEEQRKAELEAERKKREALEQEQRERAQAEAKAKAEAEEAERQALLAPDKVKLQTFADALEMIRTTKLPAVKTKQAQDITDMIDQELTTLGKKIKAAAERLK